MQNNFLLTSSLPTNQSLSYSTYNASPDVAPMEYSYVQSTPSILSSNFPATNTYKTGNISTYSSYEGVFGRANSRLSVNGVPLLDLPLYDNTNSDVNKVDLDLRRTGGNVNAGKLEGIIPIKTFPQYNKKRQGSIVLNINRIGNVAEEDIGRSNNVVDNKDSILTYIGM